jgi:hypothetical protein
MWSGLHRITLVGTYVVSRVGIEDAAGYIHVLVIA